jgi:fatty-acyl-CoA synthase
VTTSSPRYDPEEALRLIADYGATRLIVAGDAVAIPLVEAAERLGVATLGRVDSVISSGMRFGDATKARLHALGEIAVMDMLASTEGGPFAVNTTTRADDLPGAFRLLPGAVVLDERQEEVQDRPGAIGVLGFRGSLPKGYHDDEEKTRAAFPVLRGVRHVVPGDLVEVLEDHRVVLLGRGSSVVNTGGEKVYPAEVEEALLEHPAIADALVLGVPDPRFGEAVTAVVVPEPGAAVDVPELLAFVARRLAGYKKPRHVVVRASLERSPHGKVDLPRLRAAVIAELAARTGDEAGAGAS